MKIKCTTTFLDGTDRFEKDDVRTVDDARAERFIANGWASAITATELAIQDVTIPTSTEVIHG